MDKAALIIFLVGALIGLYMLRFVFRRIHIPKGLALSHGFLMGIGFIAIITYNLTTSNHHKHWQSVAVFTVAIVLGLISFLRDIGNRGKNMRVILAHGLVGLAGIVLLCLHMFGVI